MDDNLITPSDFFHRGLELLERGLFGEALRHFEQAIEREYFDPDIHLPMGEALFEVGRHEEALKHFRKAEAAGAITGTELLLWRGTCYLEQHKLRRALSAFNRVIDDNPGLAEAHFKRGLALAETGSPDRALEAFQEAERLLRAHGDAEPEELAEVLMWKGRALTRLGRRPEGMELMFESYELAPEHPGPYNEIADSFRFSGDVAEAEKWYRKGLERLPDDPSLHNDYGNLLRETGRFRESLEHLNAAIERDANRNVAYYNRALTLERLELYDEALKDYDAVIDANHGDLDARMRKLDLMTQMGLFQGAKELVESLSPVERSSNEAREAIGRMYNRMALRRETEGDGEGALDAHHAALSTHPDFLDVETPAVSDDGAEQRLDRMLRLLDDVPADHPRAALVKLLRAAARFTQWRLNRSRGQNAEQLRRGRESLRKLFDQALATGEYPAVAHKLLSEFAFYELKDDDLALEHAEKALESTPDFVGALWIKAVTLAEGKQRPELAAECYRRMLDISPNNAGVLLNLGDLYADHGQPHRALAYYRMVLEDRPGDVSINRDIGHCYLALQRYGDAIACFSRLEAQGVMQLEVRLDLAEAHLAVLERTEAGKFINEVIEENAAVDPHIDARATELMAALLLARRNPRGAKKAIAGLDPAALTTFGMLQLARAEILLESHDDAWRLLDEIIAALDPHTGDAVEARYNQARIRFAQGRYTDALDKLDEMLDASPLDQRGYRLKAWIHMLEGELDLSDEVEAAGKFAQEVAKVHRLLQYEDYQEALANADALARDFPGRIEPRYYRACALAQLGEDEVALEELRGLLKESPDLKARILEEFYLDPLRVKDRIEFRDA